MLCGRGISDLHAYELWTDWQFDIHKELDRSGPEGSRRVLDDFFGFMIFY